MSSLPDTCRFCGGEIAASGYFCLCCGSHHAGVAVPVARPTMIRRPAPAPATPVAAVALPRLARLTLATFKRLWLPREWVNPRLDIPDWSVISNSATGTSLRQGHNDPVSS